MSETVPVTVNLPDGYELADTKMRPSHAGEWYLDNSIGGARRRVGEEHPNAMRVILRPIVPATVMVEMTRKDVEYFSRLDYSSGEYQRLSIAARAALARKPEPLCGKLFADCTCVYGTSCEHDRNCTRLLGHEWPHADRKPCPVMVCGTFSATVCHNAEEPQRCLNRRPCKHDEGHGGEHE